MKTCFESEPQIPVMRGLVTTQSRSRNPGASRSTSSIGVTARFRNRWLSVSGIGWASGRTPYSSAFTPQDRTAPRARAACARMLANRALGRDLFALDGAPPPIADATLGAVPSARAIGEAEA